MAVELGKFISNKLETLPTDHPDRTLIEGVSVVIEAYVNRQAIVDEIPKRKLPTRGESIMFAADLPLSARGKRITANLYRQGEITTDQDLCHITDYDLMLNYHVGEKTVANIREYYPYTPKKG